MTRSANQFRLKECRLGLRNSTTRIAFRYGNTCLERCPQALFRATIETNGVRVHGYSADCLPPGWFDKTPGVSYEQQIGDMIAVTRIAENAFLEAASSTTPLFNAWLDVYRKVQDDARQRGYGPLLASFGVSFVERAIIDALARAANLSFAEAVRTNIYGIHAAEVHPRLAGCDPKDWLPGRTA